MPPTSLRFRVGAIVVAIGVVTAASGFVIAGASSQAAPGPAPRAPFAVTGYAEAGGTSAAQVNDSAKALTMVGVDGVNLTGNADDVTAVDSSALALLAQSHRLGKKAELLFGNFSSSIGDFSDPLAEKMFRSGSRMDDVVAALKSEVDKDGWDGITVDLESLNRFGARGHTRDDNAGLAAFMTRLRAALGTKSISICLVATTGSYADYGYDLRTIAAKANHVVLMAYDQHGSTWSNAGPVGGYPWVNASVRLLAKGVPRSQIQLGIAGYGYSWAHGRQESGAGHQYSDKAARAKVKAEHARARWSSAQKEWHATFRNHTVIWWSDARSYRARVALAHSLHLGGVAVWSLGEADPLK